MHACIDQSTSTLYIYGRLIYSTQFNELSILELNISLHIITRLDY